MNYIKVTLLLSVVSLNADILIDSQLKLGNKSILAKDLKHGQLVESTTQDKSLKTRVSVLELKESETTSIVEINLGDRLLRATPEQTFFDPVLNKWIKAKQLSNKNHLLADDMSHKAIDGVQSKIGTFETMKVSVDGSRYMFVDGVLTHNFLIIPAVLGFLGYMIFGKKKNGKIAIDYGSGHNGSIVREHGNK